MMVEPLTICCDSIFIIFALRIYCTSNCIILSRFWAFSTIFRLHIGYKICQRMHVHSYFLHNGAFKIILPIYENFRWQLVRKQLKKKMQFLYHFSSDLSKNVYISAHRQNKHMLWVFIF